MNKGLPVIVPQLGVEVLVDGQRGFVTAWLYKLTAELFFGELAEETLVITFAGERYQYTSREYCSHLQVALDNELVVLPACEVSIAVMCRE